MHAQRDQVVRRELREAERLDRVDELGGDAVDAEGHELIGREESLGPDLSGRARGLRPRRRLRSLRGARGRGGRRRCLDGRRRDVDRSDDAGSGARREGSAQRHDRGDRSSRRARLVSRRVGGKEARDALAKPAVAVKCDGELRGGGGGDGGAPLFQSHERPRIPAGVAGGLDRQIVARVLPLDADAVRDPPDRGMVEEERLGRDLQQVD